MTSMATNVYFDSVTRWRVEQFLKMEGTSFSAAIRELIKLGWDANMAQATERALPKAVRQAQATRGVTAPALG